MRSLCTIKESPSRSNTSQWSPSFREQIMAERILVAGLKSEDFQAIGRSIIDKISVAATEHQKWSHIHDLRAWDESIDKSKTLPAVHYTELYAKTINEMLDNRMTGLWKITHLPASLRSQPDEAARLMSWSLRDFNKLQPEDYGKLGWHAVADHLVYLDSKTDFTNLPDPEHALRERPKGFLISEEIGEMIHDLAEKRANLDNKAADQNKADRGDEYSL